MTRSIPSTTLLSLALIAIALLLILVVLPSVLGVAGAHAASAP